MRSFFHSGPRTVRAFLAYTMGACLGASAGGAFAQTSLADQPVLGSPVVPGNLAMPLSVEFPTAISVAHIGAYDTTRARLGYFDPKKCYDYRYYATENATNGQLSHFYPIGPATNFTCNGHWSGNFLNWASMQTIDPFRWVLTGGNRVVDTTSTTILEKAYGSNQGSESNFPNRTTSGNTLVEGATPFSWNDFSTRIYALGVRMRFSSSASGARDAALNANATPTPYTGGTAANQGTTYEVAIRVLVCDPTVELESNCWLYGSNYKPEGLIQRYSDRIRYSAFSYLNIPEGDQNGAGTNYRRDGGVMRAKQKFVGPQTPRPGQSSVFNDYREWEPDTGIYRPNPNPADATATNGEFGTSVQNSGVINYLNKFGQNGTYKTYDNVSELYYAALRYFRNLKNVTQWSEMGAANTETRNNWTDGFPVITDWDDPIQYACQSNFILGIGDVNTHADKNVPGATRNEGESTKPTAVANDDLFDARARANQIGALQGREAVGEFNGVYGGSNNSFMIAGLAYGAHVLDIRPDNAAVPQTVGRQSVSTYWLDVLEFQNYRRFNQYWYATKYGGFNVPDDFDARTTQSAIATFPTNPSSWTDGDAVGGNLGPDRVADVRPRNYYVASDPAAMVAGLTAVFESIAKALRAATTSFALSDPQVLPSGNASYSASYSTGNWTGSLTASSLSFDASGVATATPVWSAGPPNPEGAAITDLLANQLGAAGWNSNRRVVSFNPVAFNPTTGTGGGVAFRATDGISPEQLALLETPYGAGPDSTQYLNYLRGERCNEVGATATAFPAANPTCSGSPLGYRARTNLLGDIAGSKLTAVGPPNSKYSDAVNPGYAQFAIDEANRPNRPKMVYFGANDGMLHAFNGALTGDGGKEVFAYVPSALFAGVTSPSVDGLVSRGNPVFEHRALVDATPEVFDIDFARTGRPTTGVTTIDWRSILIGGLGKGGRSYYAIDVTNPGAATTEEQWAGRVLWEFPNAAIRTQTDAVGKMGFTYGRPLVTKTAKWGWVIVFPSGYNSPTGGTAHSYLFFVNPKTGALLETVTVGDGNEASYGLANVQAYRRDFADNTAESLYAGDLRGNIWRVDVRGSGAYSAVNFARLTAEDGTTRQPITTRPLVEVDPLSGRRYVLVGTGSLLDNSELASTVPQSFYAIIDGTRSTYSSSSRDFPFPITRGALVANIDTAGGSLVGNGVTATTEKPLGWFIDLGTGGSPSRGWRVILDPITNAGRVAFASLLPDGGVCSSSNTSRFYQVTFGNGQSALLNNANATIPYSEKPGVIIDIRYLCRGTNCKAYTGISNGKGGSALDSDKERGFSLPGLRRLNWRELQIVQ